MKYSEYRDLTPINNVKDGDEYLNALDWALKNPKIKNIALSGPYGAGKSSIIENALLNLGIMNLNYLKNILKFLWLHLSRDVKRITVKIQQ